MCVCVCVILPLGAGRFIPFTMTTTMSVLLSSGNILQVNREKTGRKRRKRQREKKRYKYFIGTMFQQRKKTEENKERNNQT